MEGSPIIGESVRHAVDQIRNMLPEVQEYVPEYVSEVSEDIKQRFQRLQGQVFHAARTINGANYMYRYR